MVDFNLYVYIRQESLILVPVLYIIGLFLRQTPHVPSWVHPWIQLIFASVACLLYYGVEIQSVIQGILVSGLAVISRDLIDHTIFGVNESRNKRKNKELENDRES